MVLTKTWRENFAKALIVILTIMPAIAFSQNFSNKGKEFWTGYGHNNLFTTPAGANSQEMVLYLSAEQPAEVKVSITGTTWVKNYSIPANTVISTDAMPKTGTDDCRLTNEGLYNKSIHIESDVPIVAYAHVFGLHSSGAAMLLPVESYGYTYISCNSQQEYDNDSYSWFFIVATEDNTAVNVTPAWPTKGGLVQNTAKTINLKKGQIYNVMGALIGSNKGYDMSGSIIQSVTGPDNKCHPIGVFSGSSRTLICPTIDGGGDYIMQQSFPVSAWGTRYLTAVTSSTDGPQVLNNNRFRVYVKDKTTKVRRNGALLSPLTNNSFFDFLSSGADYITADKPIMVAQFIPSAGACGATGDGDPEMFYLSPLEQAINRAAFYNTNHEAITTNYLTMVIPENGMASLKIDGSNAVDYSYAHPNLAGYRVVVKQMPTAPMQHIIESDSAFTAITYGLGYVESYGYNTGCYINNLTTISQINNVKSPDGTLNAYTCPKTPFKLTIKTIYKPSSITWQFSQASNISPAADVTVNNPVPVSTETINNKVYNVYEFDQPCTISTMDEVAIPVIISDMNIDNCSHEEIVSVKIPLQAGPQAQFTVNTICENDTAYFKDATVGTDLSNWQWKFGDATTSTIQHPAKLYATAGKYDVNFSLLRNEDGCVGDTTQSVTIHSIPVAAFTMPQAVCLPDAVAAFANQSTIAEQNTTLQNAWTFGDGGTSADKDPTHVYASAQTYKVNLIVTSAFGCADTLEQSLSQFIAKPIAKFGFKDSALCAGTTVLFVDSSKVTDATKTTWAWSFGDETTDVAKSPAKTFTQAGDYTVTLSVNEEGCASDEVQKQITIGKLPRVDAGPDVLTEPGRPVTLQGSVDDPGANIRWSSPEYLTSPTVIRPQASPLNTLMFYVTATNEQGCYGKDSVLVKVFRELKIPNAFSPNNDGINDKWNIPGLQDYLDASVEVFNRWGQIVYRSRGYSTPWDGNLNGMQLPVGAYYYIIAPNAKGYGKLTGSVLIIR